MKLISLKKIAAVSAVLMLGTFFFSCGKKDKNVEETVVETTKGKDSKGKESKQEIVIVKTKDPNAPTDFIYETNAENDGVVILEYIGSRGNVIIPEEIEGYKVKVIGVDAFRKSNIASVVCPASLEEIKNNAFRESSISAITLNEGLLSIGASAFRESGIKEISFPSTLEKFIGGYQFYQSKLSKVTLPANIAVIPEGCYSSANLSTVEIPEGVTTVSAYAFSNNDVSNSNNNISKVTFPSTLKTVGAEAFMGNPLKEATFATTEPIAYGYNAFMGCNKTGTMTIALRKTINNSGYKGKYTTMDITGCKDTPAK